MSVRDQKQTRPGMSKPSTADQNEACSPLEAFGSPLALTSMRIGQEVIHHYLDQTRESAVVFEIYRELSDYAVRIPKDVFQEVAQITNVPKIACRDGCAYCCDISVLVLAHEVFMIAFFLKEHLHPKRLNRLKQHLAEIGPKTGAMDTKQRQRAKIPCSLLSNGRCSIYSIRPLSCVGFNSTSKEQCIEYYENPEHTEPATIVGPPFLVANALNSGALVAIHERGMDDSTLELNQALDFVLNQHDLDTICQQWLNGEKVFEAICQDENVPRRKPRGIKTQDDLLSLMSGMLDPILTPQ